MHAFCRNLNLFVVENISFQLLVRIESLKKSSFLFVTIYACCSTLKDKNRVFFEQYILAVALPQIKEQMSGPEIS